MAKIYGVLGNIRGKAGGWTFSVLKGQQIMKEKSIPFNPQSTKQVAQRLVFSEIIASSRSIIKTWIKYFFSYGITRNGTSFGRFMSKNLLAMGNSFDGTKLVFGDGSLESPNVDEVAYNTVDGETEATLFTTSYGNGLDTDKLHFLIFNLNTSRVIFTRYDVIPRSGAAWLGYLPPDLDAADLYYFFIATRGSVANNDITMVSKAVTGFLSEA